MMKMLRFGQYESINSFDIGMDTSFVAVSTLDSSVHLQDISDGQLVATYRGGHTSEQYHGSVKFTLDDGNRYLATGSEDGAICMYDSGSRQVACQIRGSDGHRMPVISVDVARQNRIVSGSADGSIKIWEYWQ